MNSIMNRVLKSVIINSSSGSAFYNRSSCCLMSTVPIPVPVAKKIKDYPPNNSLQPTFVNNRNPRNLEKLRIGHKPDGWTWEKPGRNFWNKVTFEVTGRHIVASIIHFEGSTPVSASTREWCIKKFLYSTNDTPAAEAVGKVLAHRCLQAGITEVACFYTEIDRAKEKINIFLNALEKGGITLSEPEQYVPPYYLNDRSLPEKGWNVAEEVDEEVFKKLESIYKKS